MFKAFAKFGLKGSEREISTFIKSFESGPSDQNGMILGTSAMIHYSMSSLDPEFSMLLNSGLGENQGAISRYILQLNKLVNEYSRDGEKLNAAAMRVWNITLRCMSHNSFRHYGQYFWAKASENFEMSKMYLEQLLLECIEQENKKMEMKARGGLGLVDFIPPQFKAR